MVCLIRGEATLSLAIETYLIVLAVVGIACAPSVGGKGEHPCSLIDVDDMSSYQFASRSQLTKLLPIAVIEVVRSIARAFAPPNNLTIA